MTNREVSQEVIDTVAEIIFTNDSNNPNVQASNDNYSPIEDILSRARNLLSTNNNSNFAEINNDPFKC